MKRETSDRRVSNADNLANYLDRLITALVKLVLARVQKRSELVSAITAEIPVIIGCLVKLLQQAAAGRYQLALDYRTWSRVTPAAILARSGVETVLNTDHRMARAALRSRTANEVRACVKNRLELTVADAVKGSGVRQIKGVVATMIRVIRRFVREPFSQEAWLQIVLGTLYIPASSMRAQVSALVNFGIEANVATEIVQDLHRLVVSSQTLGAADHESLELATSKFGKIADGEMMPAFAFDFDGTIAPTSSAHCRAWVETLRRRYPELPEDELQEFLAYQSGKTNEAALQLFFPGEKQCEIRSEIAKEKAELAAKLAAEVAPFADFIDAFLALKRSGHRVGVVTSSPRALLHTFLQRNPSLAFDASVCGDDCDESKPSPKPLFNLCEKLRSPVGNTIVVGDAHADFEMSKRGHAKAFVYYTPPGTTPDKQIIGQNVYRISSHTDLPPLVRRLIS